MGWGGGNVVLLWLGKSVESVLGLCSNDKYKCVRNWVSLVLLLLDGINHNVEVLFYEGASL